MSSVPTPSNLRSPVRLQRGVSGLSNISLDSRHESDTVASRRQALEYKNALDARCGSVLNHSSIIKVDHFPDNKEPTSNNPWLNRMRISGAPQLRSSGLGDLYAVAQPTVHGIRGMCNLLQARHNNSSGEAPRTIVWLMLREEPLIFVNGRSVVLRERAEPFHNMGVFRGITPERIEDLEWRLKHDVVAEAARYNGNIVMHEEVTRREVELTWEATSMDSVLTPSEVFAKLRMEGYHIRYERVPLTPEQPPGRSFLDQLLRCVLNTPADTAFVFNCHTGNTRSTFAMVAACLVQLWRGALNAPPPRSIAPVRSATPPPATASVFASGSRGFHSPLPSRATSPVFEQGPRPMSPPRGSDRPLSSLSHDLSGSMLSRALASPIPSSRSLRDVPLVRVVSGVTMDSIAQNLDLHGGASAGHIGTSQEANSTTDYTARQLLAGWYLPILRLLRMVDAGRESKLHVDYFIDRCAHLVNLRTAIYRHRTKAGQARSNLREAAKIKRAGVSLQRYAILVLFDAYLGEQVQQEEGMDGNHSPSGGAGGGNKPFSVGFEAWVDSRPEIRTLLNDVENEPRDSLEAVNLQQALRSVRMVQRDEDGVEKTKSFDDESSGDEDNEGSTEGGLTIGDPAEERRFDDAQVAAMERVMMKRRGVMLNTDTILKSDHLPEATMRSHQQLDRQMSNGSLAPTPPVYNDSINSQQQVGGTFDVVIRGAPNFRRVPGMQIHGVCTPTFGAAEQIIRYCMAAYGAKKVVWINLREEAICYVNERPYVLRSVSKPFRNVQGFEKIDADRLDAAEMRLRDDVLAEAKKYKSKVLVHQESEGKSLQADWESVGEDDVMTPKQMYARLVESGLPVDYVRIPVTPEQEPDLSDIDAILELMRAGKHMQDTHFIFNCQMGRGRSTLAMVLASTELDDTWSEHVDSSRDGAGVADGFRLQVTKPSATEPEYQAVLMLVRVLPGGVVANRWVDKLVELCGSVENIKNAIEMFRHKSSMARSEERSAEHLERSLLYLRRYFMLVAVGAYQYQRRIAVLERAEHVGTFENGVGGKGDKINVAAPIEQETFKEWWSERREIQTFFDLIEGKAAVQRAQVGKVLSAPPPVGEDSHARTMVEQEVLASAEDEGDADHENQLMMRFVARRSGMVLTTGSIIKSDHFPGCDRLKGERIRIDGAPNFRMVGMDLSKHVDAKSTPPGKPGHVSRAAARVSDPGVYGVAIPTRTGVEAVLKHVAGEKGRAQHIVWLSLREEPILYIVGKPYVLRKLEHPFENLEHTGINCQRVEAMEDRLKKDVLTEMYENGGKLLLHDEDEAGLTPSWVTVDNPSSVLTPRDLYEEMRASGFNVEYRRVPITDEQAPKLCDVDEIVDVIKEAPLDSRIVVNCQMGRGRTTTGLVVACTTRLWMRNALLDVPKALEVMKHHGFMFRSRVVQEGLEESRSVEALCLRGEYTSINRMAMLMADGRTVKSVMDGIIDLCDSMQNLREATYELKVRADSVELGPVQRAGAQSRGLHYIRRYFYLVALGGFFFSQSFTQLSLQVMGRFEQWARDREEIRNIVRSIGMGV